MRAASNLKRRASTRTRRASITCSARALGSCRAAVRSCSRRTAISAAKPSAAFSRSAARRRKRSIVQPLFKPLWYSSIVQRQGYQSSRSRALLASVTASVVSKIHSTAPPQARTHHSSSGSAARPRQGAGTVTASQATLRRCGRQGAPPARRDSTTVRLACAGWARILLSRPGPSGSSSVRSWRARTSACQPSARAEEMVEDVALAIAHADPDGPLRSRANGGQAVGPYIRLLAPRQALAARLMAQTALSAHPDLLVSQTEQRTGARVRPHGQTAMHQKAALVAVADRAQPLGGRVGREIEFGGVLDEQHHAALGFGRVPCGLAMWGREGRMAGLGLIEQVIGGLQLGPACHLSRQAEAGAGRHGGADVHGASGASRIPQPGLAPLRLPPSPDLIGPAFLLRCPRRTSPIYPASTQAPQNLGKSHAH